jgi:hypothetical protein
MRRLSVTHRELACGFGRNTREQGTANVNGSGQKIEIERGSDSDSIVRGDLADTDTMKDLVESPRAELAMGMRAVRERARTTTRPRREKSRWSVGFVNGGKARIVGTSKRFLACVVVCCGVSMRSRAA